jgi:hypothetical protein
MRRWLMSAVSSLFFRALCNELKLHANRDLDGATI